MVDLMFDLMVDLMVDLMESKTDQFMVDVSEVQCQFLHRPGDLRRFWVGKLFPSPVMLVSMLVGGMVHEVFGTIFMSTYSGE